jgi:inosine/xanthosine triphosphate pyrophosphatase family protein
VLVEDTSLCFRALNGLPGPYVKWFVESLGNEGLYRLLAGHTDHRAFCRCALAFSASEGAEPLIFVGHADGTIVPPQGEGGFGWEYAARAPHTRRTRAAHAPHTRRTRTRAHVPRRPPRGPPPPRVCRGVVPYASCAQRHLRP